MTTTLAPARPEAAAGRATLTPLAARETRRFVRNPVFLLAVALTAYTLWSGQRGTVTEIDGANTIAATFFGGFGMLAAFWLTRSMQASEPVVGVTPTTLPACECRKPHPRHPIRRYSLIRPPTRACLRTRYCSRSTGSGSGLSGAAACRERCGRC